jgi:hypothetical protein
MLLATFCNLHAHLCILRLSISPAPDQASTPHKSGCLMSFGFFSPVAAPSACRTGATAATWSLQRLDALAAEVIDVLQQEHPQTLGSADNSSSSSKPSAARPRVLANKYPMQVLSAVNSVLFGRQGYAACNRYGTPSDSQLAAVLESGPGSCAALTVLYLEVRLIQVLRSCVTIA